MIKDIEELKDHKQIIDLSGPEGNAYVLLGYAKRYCNILGTNIKDCKTYSEIRKEMTSSDYENLVEVFDKYFGKYVDLYR